MEAIQDNWFNESVLGILKDIKSKLINGEAVETSQEYWSNLVAKQVEDGWMKAESLIAKHGVRNRVFQLYRELHSLNSDQLTEVFETIDSQNQIPELLNGEELSWNLSVDYPGVNTAAKDLFDFCYEKLADLDIRQKQYQIIFESLEDKICPFCGIERVNSPEEHSQDLDHYLAKCSYPLAAINLANLAPMCISCNRNYKRDQDILHCDSGNRRPAFFPYNCTPPEISLLNSAAVEDVSPLKFDWNIEFCTHVDKAETWASVFSVRERYGRDILSMYFNRWIEGLSSFCRKLEELPRDASDDQVKERIERYTVLKAESPNIGNGGFLEPLVFKFLLKEFEEGHQRLISFLRDAVLGVSIDFH